MFTKFYKTGFDKSAFPDSKIETEIEKIKRFFENLLPAGRSAPSIFDFRETFERYVGLSFEIQTENPEPSTSEQEFYRITNHQQKELGEICLNRRNRNRLAFHQKLARGDFFLIFEKLVAAAPDKQPLFEQAAELFRLVDDNEALDRIGRPAPAPAQTTGNETVNDLGKEKWKNGKPQLTAANRISTNLRIISATTSSSAKD
ncbi:MAG: hypothetical protein JSS81_07985 [Acidobacteria bacterium]|nr:hypothetical protein [Acidobacteriota bacterium]